MHISMWAGVRMIGEEIFMELWVNLSWISSFLNILWHGSGWVLRVVYIATFSHLIGLVSPFLDTCSQLGVDLSSRVHSWVHKGRRPLLFLDLIQNSLGWVIHFESVSLFRRTECWVCPCFFQFLDCLPWSNIGWLWLLRFQWTLFKTNYVGLRVQRVRHWEELVR